MGRPAATPTSSLQLLRKFGQRQVVSCQFRCDPPPAWLLQLIRDTSVLSSRHRRSAFPNRPGPLLPTEDSEGFTLLLVLISAVAHQMHPFVMTRQHVRMHVKLTDGMRLAGEHTVPCRPTGGEAA